MNSVFDAVRPIASLLRSRRGKTDSATEQDVNAEIGRIVSSSFSMSETYEKFAAQVKRVLPYDRAIITVLDTGAGTFSIDYVLGTEITGMGQGDVFPLKNSFVSQVANSPHAIRCDPSNEYPNLKLFQEAGLISSIATPLIANETVIGVFHLASSNDGAFDEASLGKLERIGNQIAGAMASAILLKAERSKASQLKGVYQVAAIVAKPESFEEKSQEIVNILVQITMADLAVLWRSNRSVVQATGPLNPVAEAGPGTKDIDLSGWLSEQNAVSHSAFSQGRIMVINDYPNFPDASPLALAKGYKSVISIPVRSGGQTERLLTVGSKTLDFFNAERVALLTAISDATAPLFESANLRWTGKIEQVAKRASRS